MQTTVFYSWQSDLPNATNRSFIETALERAAKTIRNDDSIQIEPVIERDTAGVPGAPDIADTIFQKIDQASVFVCDVSIINQTAKRSAKRPTPNPNVLIELGYAIKKLGWKRIVMVINTAYGKVEQLPFDLRMKRVVQYSMPEDNPDRASERKNLEGTLERELRTIFESIEKEKPIERSIEDEVKEAVLNSLPNRSAITRNYMVSLVDRLVSIAPNYSAGGEPDDLLLQSIEDSKELVTKFADVVDTIDITKDGECVSVLYRNFDRLLNLYCNPRDFSGLNHSYDFEFYKFISYELFVILFTCLIRNEHWLLISELLETGFYIENMPNGLADTMSFDYISSRVGLLEHRKRRLKLKRISIHADLLNERHSQGKLAQLIPMKQFIDADYFLFLRSLSQVKIDPKEANLWYAWSTIFMGDFYIPKYLVAAKYKHYAEQLLRPLGIATIENFRTLIAEQAPRLKRLFRESWDFEPLNGFDAQSIGSR